MICHNSGKASTWREPLKGNPTATLGPVPNRCLTLSGRHGDWEDGLSGAQVQPARTFKMLTAVLRREKGPCRAVSVHGLAPKMLCPDLAAKEPDMTDPAESEAWGRQRRKARCSPLGVTVKDSLQLE